MLSIMRTPPAHIEASDNVHAPAHTTLLSSTGPITSLELALGGGIDWDQEDDVNSQTPSVATQAYPSRFSYVDSDFDEWGQVSETAEPATVDTRRNGALLDFATVPAATKVPASIRVASYTEDFSTVSELDLSAFHSACDRVFGSRFDCSSQTFWIQRLMKAEEAFSVGPSYATTSARNPDLAEDFRPRLMEMVFSDAVKHGLPREVVCRTVAYLDLVLARSVNIANKVLLDVYLLCLLLAEDYYHDSRLGYTELIWGEVWDRCLDPFPLKNAYALPFDWDLGCPTVLDWLQVYFANFIALTRRDAAALEFVTMPSIPDKMFAGAFFLLENLIQSCDVADLPYSVIAAGVFKAVTVDLMPDQELDSCLKFTGYTDEQLYKVTRFIPDEVELEFRLDCVVSVNADILVQAKYDTVAAVGVEVQPRVRVKKERVRRSKRIAAKVPPRRSARIAAQKRVNWGMNESQTRYTHGIREDEPATRSRPPEVRPLRMGHWSNRSNPNGEPLSDDECPTERQC
ncbi:hypothetical protein HDU78_000879 [Chytriomyces hyalinus]|nr:hypothetical protein HDU78_000879 [Chytriomyces hyalinus]